MKKVLKYVLSFVLAGVLVYFAFRGVDWTAFWSGLQQTRWGWVALFVLFSAMAPCGLKKDASRHAFFLQKFLEDFEATRVFG